MKHVLVDLLRLLVLTGLHCCRDIAAAAERQSESIQDTRIRCNSPQVAKWHAASGSAASLRMIARAELRVRNPYLRLTPATPRLSSRDSYYQSTVVAKKCRRRAIMQGVIASAICIPAEPFATSLKLAGMSTITKLSRPGACLPDPKKNVGSYVLLYCGA